MMEIYNEKMRDLLDPSKSEKLKIRETKQLGVYVDQVFIYSFIYLFVYLLLSEWLFRCLL
jgi:Trk-type K+ transport system membrane component